MDEYLTKKDIENELKCKQCYLKSDVAKVLHGGNFICSKCEEEFLNKLNYKNCIKCPKCTATLFSHVKEYSKFSEKKTFWCIVIKISENFLKGNKCLF